MPAREKNEEGKIKKQFWVGYGVFLAIVGLIALTFLVLSTLNFFG